MNKSVCALGFFDGVHEAHSIILKECIRYGREHNLKNVALTFEKSPAEFFGAEIKYLTPLKQKETLMYGLGIEEVKVLPCNEETLSLSPEEFVKNILIDKLNAKALFCGFNYTFGKGAKGNTETLKEICDKYGVEVFVSPCMKEGGLTVSSTEIRAALAEGDLDTANKLLSRPFQLIGVVATGKKLGRELGFPTANLYPDSHFPLIPHGVYATKTMIDDKEYFSVTNVGTNPTVGDKNLRVETYISDFDQEIYGKCICVSFYKFLRGEKTFSSVDELKEQIAKDTENTINYLKTLH